MLANSGQMWFYHAPSKRLDASKQLVPAASQIPGLAALDPLDQEAWEREVGVKNKTKESDSHYIRLAKQGGRKNLLNFSQLKTIDDSQPKSYPRVDWFDHHDSDPEKDKQILSQSIWQPPEYMVHEYEPVEDGSDKSEEDKTVEKRPKRAPFYTDNMSVWARKEEEKLIRKKSKRRGQAFGQNYSKKLPELTSRIERSPPVKFSKLIGGEYGNEWYRDQAGRGMRKRNPNEAKSDKGYLNLTEYQQSICKKVIPPKKLKPIVLTQGKRPTDQGAGKEMFKLSKFNHVSSKLKTGAD